jgi:hypothetical protein
LVKFHEICLFQSIISELKFLEFINDYGHNELKNKYANDVFVQNLVNKLKQDEQLLLVSNKTQLGLE